MDELSDGFRRMACFSPILSLCDDENFLLNDGREDVLSSDSKRIPEVGFLVAY